MPNDSMTERKGCVADLHQEANALKSIAGKPS
jgi:hypothetical protein